ncbi:NADP-dependent oxidoreductase [Bacillus solimangrovi]|uniref:NADP-dependent oxidoreductase n=1 Tax=Bacillus solimangrovi TaxID=1305675 RepID=A0A1E5LH00_9BACI|nr:NADP-dependent oxidoreductase [Bacillus solimangrovi]OEH93358.1 NADP-dependent oxidoreductase [Bacillus solimangrovi]
MNNLNKELHLTNRPVDMPTLEDFRIVEKSISELKENEVLVKTLYLSVDPYMRGRMSDAKSYIEPFQLNEKISGGAVGEVIESNSDNFKQGDIVAGMLGWSEYNVVNGHALNKINPELAPVTTSLGILGMPGLTAYFGLLDIGQPKEGETVVISGAAGAVGSIVGQIAKIKGAYVVGIAGSDDKTDYLMNELNFDKAINYKTTPNMKEALQEACPNGVDVYFENVGGEISDAVFTMLNKFARICVCGAISTYNLPSNEDIGPRIQRTLIKSSVLMKGFVVNDYAERWSEGIKQIAQWLNEGKLTYEETITEGFENIPDAFLGLFKGSNLGKQLVKIAEPTYAKL